MDQSEKVADEFSKIYSHEWKEARAALSSEKHEEEIIYLLMRIVRVSCYFDSVPCILTLNVSQKVLSAE